MAEKHVTLKQLQMLAERALADSTSRVAELAKLVVQGLREVDHVSITVTLPAADWSDREQTIQNDSLLASSEYWYLMLGCDADNFADCSEACITADNITEDGKITFHCMATPEVDLTVYILRLEVDTTDE
jgi:hypothetical protein